MSNIQSQNIASSENLRNLPIADNLIGRQLQEIAGLTYEVAEHLSHVLGVNRTDLAVMEQLMTDGPLPPTELAKRLKLTTAGMTLVIDRLERGGHIVRERQEKDKRRILVKPVQRTVTQTYHHLAPMLLALDMLLNKLTPAETTLIQQFLSQVIAVYRNAIPVTEKSNMLLEIKS